MILKNKKKIRIIIGSLNVGGTEKQLLEIINRLAGKKWEIELITLKEKGNLAEDLNPKIKVNNLNIKSSFKVIRLCLIVLKLFKIFKKDPNTLTHFFLPQAYIVGMIALGAILLSLSAIGSIPVGASIPVKLTSGIT